MKKLQVVIALVAVMLLSSLSAAAQTYNVDYKNLPVEQVIKDLRKQTGHQFVYKKEVLQGVPNVTCNYKNATLEQLLNRIFYMGAGLEYEIVKGTVVLKKATKDFKYFKKNVSGMITDENEEPLPGVTVMLKGTNTGVSTDLDGQFTILTEGKEPVLEITYVGMKPKTVRVSPKEPFLYVKMEADENILDEVLVTGYQNIKRENATGSYQLISSKKLDERHTGTIVENLEGQIPGLMSYNNGMNGGGENALTIRGISSFQARTNPLVVVDGLPIEGSIETVNPYNIENITVLKDASAAAIYGARASNGVIVITTKRANQEKLEVDFSTDITISEKQNYDNYGWISAADLIKLEKYNFNSMRDAAALKAAADQAAQDESDRTGEDLAEVMKRYAVKPWVTKGASSFNELLNRYDVFRLNISPVTQLLTANYLGNLSDSDMNAQLSRMANNNYRKEWADAYDRQQVLQQYNLSLRTRGKYLNSSVVLNYKGDNLGTVKEHNNALTFSYRGDLDITKWLKASFGTNIISERAKTHITDIDVSGRNTYQPYMSMYNADGSEAPMEGYIGLYEPVLQDPEIGLKDAAYYPLRELNMNFNNSRRTNIRSFVNATATILPGWTASAHFQYEDIYYKRSAYTEADSYRMRFLYNNYTQETIEMQWDYDYDTWEMIQVPVSVITHHIPEGGMLSNYTQEGAHYTFRAQTGYDHVFAGKHAVEALAGFEFRESHTTSNSSILIGYDEQTQTNRTGFVNLGELKTLWGKGNVLGPNYSMGGAPGSDDYTTSDVLHRFYSLYFTGNYTYDKRYSASVSYRVDKTDLFGADPKFRGRPLWSVGASWNIHNEDFMKQYPWIDALKLRTSYGLTGNIDSSVSSYLTASLENEFIYGNLGASLDTPPNDQLRWEKTASWNFGLDFSLWSNRLSGSLDYYLKKGSDLLTLTDLDPTTGWTSLTINNGEMTNKGIELQLNGQIIKPETRNSFGLNAAFNIAYNKNEVTKVTHEVNSGYTNLMSYTLHKGYPVHSLFSYQYAGIVFNEDTHEQTITWNDHNGKQHFSEVYSDDFTVEDGVYSGSLDPKVMSSFTPEITWNGFSLSAMFSYYGGHVMRARMNEMDATYGSSYGYRNGEVNSSALNYWEDDSHTQYVANGYMGLSNVIGYTTMQYMDANVVPADYLKLRNIVLGYSFPKNWCRKLGMNSIRLRVQMNNVATWVKNKYDIDPEANSPIYGTASNKTPRSYTMSLNVNF
ncbi:MAG: SusC/RagA family TonB-linked outer membrane protein [Prevotella sp.]|nr:SusC/RagA family TonB-linked outer membrane protein [Prevotella sp.]